MLKYQREGVPKGHPLLSCIALDFLSRTEIRIHNLYRNRMIHHYFIVVVVLALTVDQGHPRYGVIN